MTDYFFMLLKTPKFQGVSEVRTLRGFFFLPPSTAEIMEMTARTAKKLVL